MEILWHLKFAETQTRPDAAFKHKDPRFPNECENIISAVIQSYEIKLPPGAFLGFKILEIFSVEN